MVTVNLAPGQHTIKMTLAGYNPFQATISVSSTGTVTCVSVLNGHCNTSFNPGIIVSGTTITGYLKKLSVAPVTSFNGWVVSKGGATGISGNLSAVGEIIDGYLQVKDLGFIVSLTNVGSVIDYYLGVVI